jgi:HupE / UreJ protein
MSEFQLYFMLGKEHILDYANGYDHILFVLALCVMHLMRDWKKLLVLITAFTIGHSITLALSTLEIVSVNPELIEFLIPLTIFITAVSIIFKREENDTTLSLRLSYAYALFFGLIHGLGFSNYLKSILGKDESIIKQLLAFNIGLEFGQIIIIAIVLFASFIIIEFMKRSTKEKKIILSAVIAFIALRLMKDKIFW